MNVFVTGGAGYIGSASVQRLVEAGHEVVVFDNLLYGHRAAVHPDAHFVEGDLADAERVRRTMHMHRPDAIMHFASHSLVGESEKLPFKYLRDNVVTGMNVLEAALQCDVGKFILSSTANLFSKPAQLPITEEEALVPGSPYGESKLMLERTLDLLDRRFGLRYAALRYFNACGALSEDLGEDHNPESHLIPIVLQVALGQREHITIFGTDYDTRDGTCIRDYIHVSDLASAHIKALESLGAKSDVFNVGIGQGYTVREVIEAAREVTGHPIPVIEGDRRPGDPPVLIAGSEKIQTTLGWKPEIISLKDMVASAWAWHKKHPNGYT